MEKKFEENFKPRTWLLIILIILGLAISVVLIDKYVKYRKDQKEQVRNTINERTKIIDEQADKVYNEIQKQIEKQHEEEKEYDVSAFNSTFEYYAGTKMGGSVTHLLDLIITNNKTKKQYVITVSRNGVETTDEEEIRSFKSGIDTFADYEVIIDYNDAGYINKVTIR